MLSLYFKNIKVSFLLVISFNIVRVLILDYFKVIKD